MKLYPTIWLTALVMLSSCYAEDLTENSNSELKKMTFTAVAGEEGGTRTALAENGISVNWQEDDYVSVFDAAGQNNAFALTGGAGTSIGELTGTLTVESPTRIALYPYADGATISGNVISKAVMPADQTAVKDGFDPQSNIMTAYSTGTKFYFKQAVCYVKIQTNDVCKSIVFRANGGEKLAGTVKLKIGSDGVASHEVTANESSAVTLVPSDGTTIPAGTYYVGILPQRLSRGFTVECYNASNNTMLVKSYAHSTNVFSRDKIVSLGSVSLDDGWTKENAHICQHYYEYGKGKNIVQAVDLGLPSGIKWANINLGATKIEDYGDYYAWGALEPWLESYDQSGRIASVSEYCHWSRARKTYEWYNAPYQTVKDATTPEQCLWTKYMINPTYQDPSADPAELAKTVMDLQDDAAHYQWGGKWRLPTYEEFNELYSNCTLQFVYIGDIYFIAFISNINNKYILIPLAGRIVQNQIGYSGVRGSFYLTDVGTTNNSYYDAFGGSYAYGFFSDIDLLQASWLWSGRYGGTPLRAVYDPNL